MATIATAVHNCADHDYDGLWLEAFGETSMYDVAHVYDEDGNILMAFREPQVRTEERAGYLTTREDDLRDTIRAYVHGSLDLNHPAGTYYLTFDPGRDCAEDEEITIPVA